MNLSFTTRSLSFSFLYLSLFAADVLLLAFLDGAEAKATITHPVGSDSPVTTRVNLNYLGHQLVKYSANAAISRDGRFVAYMSLGTRLVPNDQNYKQDVFVRDRQFRSNERVSVSTGGGEANDNSIYPAITPDGRFVAFVSTASNLAAADHNGQADVFVRDRRTGITERASIGSDGLEGNMRVEFETPAISSDGRFVAFATASALVQADDNMDTDVYVRDRRLGITQRISLSPQGTSGDSSSFAPVMSSDGRYIAYYSYASNLVQNDRNGLADIFLFDRKTQKTTRESVDAKRNEIADFISEPHLSGNGRYLGFSSSSVSLVGLDTNGTTDAFVKNLATGFIERVSISTEGTEADGYSELTGISNDGSKVIFESGAKNLVSGDTNGAFDVFLRDREARTTERISVSTSGAEAEAASSESVISANGTHVAFTTEAATLVPNDTNSLNDVFVRDR